MAKSTLSFSGVKLSYFDTRRNEAGLFVRIHFSADLNPDLAHTLQWHGLYDEQGEISQGWEEMQLIGDLSLERMVMIPSDLEQHRVELDCYAADHFLVKRTKKKGDEDFEYRLHFTVKSRVKKASQRLAEYWDVIGEQFASLSVVYEISDVGEGDHKRKASDKEQPLFSCEHCIAGRPLDVSGMHIIQKTGRKDKKVPCTQPTNQQDQEQQAIQ